MPASDPADHPSLLRRRRMSTPPPCTLPFAARRNLAPPRLIRIGRMDPNYIGHGAFYYADVRPDHTPPRATPLSQGIRRLRARATHVPLTLRDRSSNFCFWVFWDSAVRVAAYFTPSGVFFARSCLCNSALRRRQARYTWICARGLALILSTSRSFFRSFSRVVMFVFSMEGRRESIRVQHSLSSIPFSKSEG
ncbi:hypothetical protein B0H13DRAFT_2320099 [Mycena leptocephala]|nr:hypothetical protein B0H13DRAFT_2320099 [Mycena leptocephala]